MDFTHSEEYQLFVGLHDAMINDELVKEAELEKMIIGFFEKQKVDFTIFKCEGGYLYGDKNYVLENALCINIIGVRESNMLHLAKAVSMFMNQDSVVLVRNRIKSIIC